MIRLFRDNIIVVHDMIIVARDWINVVRDTMIGRDGELEDDESDMSITAWEVTVDVSMK